MGRRGSNLRQPEAGGDGAGGQLCAASGQSRSCAGDEATLWRWKRRSVEFSQSWRRPLLGGPNSVLNVKAKACTFNQERALVGSRSLLRDCGNIVKGLLRALVTMLP